MQRGLGLFLAAVIATPPVAAVSACTAIPPDPPRESSPAIPPDPVWESSAPFGAWNNGGFILYNNEWNPSAGPQTIWADSYSHWGVQSNQAAGNVAVETYPCVQKDFSDVPISSFRLIRNGFTESMPVGDVGLDAEAADDVWLNNNNIEVMIWVDNHGQTPAGHVIGNVTIFGQRFALWYGGITYTFVLNHNETSGVTHILASIQWLIDHGYVPASATLAQVNFGWEIASTNGKPTDFAVTQYWLNTQLS
jgi:hypothetical protein